MNSNLVFITSDPMSVVAFLLPHIKVLNAIAPVRVFTNSKKSLLLEQYGVNVPIDFVPIVRPISPWSDIKALLVLYWRLKKSSPLAVHTITPKAGLLGMLAAWLARVPVRVHSFTGQVWITHTGFMHWLLKSADKLIAKMATDCLVDSPSQRAFLIEQGVLSAKYSRVLGAGSICGVNTKRFSPNKSVRKVIRDSFGTPKDTTVCLYLGRLNRDKGVLDLASAFAEVAVQYPKVELWVVGPDEDDYFQQMLALLGKAGSQVKRVDYTPTPERIMQAADLFCLPSHREGFGSSVIEAGACGVPTLASRIYGLTDAVAEGQTGWMHKAGDFQDLALQLRYLFSNQIEIFSKGQAARKHAETHFKEEVITDEMLRFYQERLS